MQPDTVPIPHGWQLVYLALTAIASSLATVIADRVKNRRREPAEMRRIDAETENIRVTAEVAAGGFVRETLREIQAVTRQAEERHEKSLAREEQLRNQVLFWRNKAEELDGELIDSRQANGLMDSRLRLNEHQIKKLKSLLDYHNISYSELDQPKDK